MKKRFSLLFVFLMILQAATAPAPATGGSPEGGSHESASPVIGAWHASQGPADVFSERFAFFHDGTFLFGYSEFDGLERVRYKSGQWQEAEGVLTLAVHRRLVLAGGHIVNDEELGDLWEGGEAKLEILDPPLLEEHTVRVTGYAPGTERETLTIDDTVYYDSDATFDMMDGYFRMLSGAFKSAERTFGFGMAGKLWIDAFMERALQTGLSLDNGFELFTDEADYSSYVASRGEVGLQYEVWKGHANNFFITLDFHAVSEADQAECLRIFRDFVNVAVYASEGGGPPEIMDEIVQTLCRGFDGKFPGNFDAAQAFGTYGVYRIQLDPCFDDDEVFIEMYGEKLP